MPRYSFVCEECFHAFQQRMSVSEFEDKDSLSCPQCSSPEIRQQFQNFNVISSRQTESKPKKPGTVVQQMIEENKQILRETKEDLRKQRNEWKES